MMAWTAAVAILWPLNIPLAALAYKIRLGTNKNPLKPKEYWIRSGAASFAVAVITLVMLGVDYFLAQGSDFPAGPIHLVVFMAYVPAAMWALFVLFALEDLMQALSVYVIYTYLPVLVLYLLNAIIGFAEPLGNLLQRAGPPLSYFRVVDWLKMPT
jgi:hypothetical protein